MEQTFNLHSHFLLRKAGGNLYIEYSIAQYVSWEKLFVFFMFIAFIGKWFQVFFSVSLFHCVYVGIICFF